MERQSLGTPLLHAIFRKEAEAIRLALFGNRLALRFIPIASLPFLGIWGQNAAVANSHKQVHSILIAQIE
jgi:hypothetical protein